MTTATDEEKLAMFYALEEVHNLCLNPDEFAPDLAGEPLMYELLVQRMGEVARKALRAVTFPGGEG